MVETAHGRLPLPAPATLEILKGVPLRAMGMEGEWVTSTGAAILKAVCKEFGDFPPMLVKGIGYGLGDRRIEGVFNGLRILLFEEEESFPVEEVVLLETDIDDISPEGISVLWERIKGAGALDITVSPIHMKKGRPGFRVTVMTRAGDRAGCVRAIFEETTTFGIRMHRLQRYILKREFETVTTKWGGVRVKRGMGPDGKIYTVSPEFDDCLDISRRYGVPFKEVFREVVRGIKE